MRPYLQLTRGVDIKEIKRRERGTNDLLERRRLTAVRLRSEGYTPPKVCDILGIHVCSLRNWVNAFNKHGLDGLKPQEKRWGRKRKLSEEQIKEICKWIDEGPSESQGCYFWTGRKLMKEIERKFGVRYSLDSVYWLLKDLGYKRIVPKTRHHKADPKAAEEFKKNSRIWSRR